VRIFFLIVFACISLAACGYQERQGEFTYKCRGGGILDGAFCEAFISERFFLSKTEFAERNEVILMYGSPDRDWGASALPGSNTYVSAVGINDRFLVAETNDQFWYVFYLPSSTANQEWIEPLGPFQPEELQEEFLSVELPDMRSTW
jgi:hypothetical protein